MPWAEALAWVEAKWAREITLFPPQAWLWGRTTAEATTIPESGVHKHIGQWILI